MIPGGACVVADSLQVELRDILLEYFHGLLGFVKAMTGYVGLHDRNQAAGIVGFGCGFFRQLTTATVKNIDGFGCAVVERAY